MSKLQRPVEILPGLRSKEVWELEDLDKETIRLVRALKNNWKTILLEGLQLKKKEKMWMKEKRLLKNGTWDQMSFIGKLRHGMTTTETNT